MKKLTKILCALLVVLTMSCAKDGATGPQGPAGTNGTNGTNGNANVLYSDWFDVAQADWSGIGTATLTKNINEAAITADVVDKGVVLVYHQYSGNSYQLPFEYSTNGDHTDFRFSVGLIRLRYFLGSGGNINSMSTVKYRYIIVPATTHVRLKKPLKDMTYDEVCSLYNIPM